ncbi:MAG: LamG-like jellyroll fold domain-containing protein [Acidobacteriota bacterium]
MTPRAVVPLLVLIVASMLARAAGPDSGPVLALSFNTVPNTVVRDASGRRNDGVTNGQVTIAPGRYGNALAFGGQSAQSIVTVGDDPSLDLTTGMTLEAWVYPTATLARWPTIIMKQQPAQLVYVLYANADTNQANTHLSIGGSLRDARGGTQLPLNTWTHLAATYDGTTIRMYVNATQVGTRTIAGAILTSNSPLQIGGNRIWNDEWFTGRIDEVRVYDRALSPAEITSDMNTPITDLPIDNTVEGAWGTKLNWPYVPVHLALLSTGRVLSWNNFGDSQIFDPTNDGVTVTDTPRINTFCAGHAQIPDGRLLVAGGHVDAYVGKREANVFDPRTESWSALPDMHIERWYPTVTTLPDGRVFTISGNSTCRTCWANTPEIYDPIVNSWTNLTSATRFVPFYPHTSVLPDGRLLFTGSQLQPMETLTLDVATQQWTVVDPVATDGGSSVMYRLGKVLKSGTAWNPDDPPIASSTASMVLDMNQPSPAWRTVAPMRFPRTQQNLTMLPDGSVLCTGGGRNTDVYDEDSAVHQAEVWSSVTEQWTLVGSMQMPRMYHSNALLLPDARVLVAGGGAFGPDQPNAELYSPPYLFKGSRPTFSAAPSRLSYGSIGSMATPDAAAIDKVTLLRMGSTTHAFNYDQRYIELPFTRATGGLRITAPANGNIAPPGYYMLFLVAANGVPAVAQILRVPRAADVLLGEASAPAGPGAPFRIEKATGGYQLTWSAPTGGPAPTSYRLYRTPLGSMANPECEANLGTGTSAVVPTLSSNQGFLVAARRDGEDGPLGKDSSGAIRPNAIGSRVCP